VILQKGVWILSDDVYPSISSTTTRVDFALMAHYCNFVCRDIKHFLLGDASATMDLDFASSVVDDANVSLDIKEFKALSTRHGPYTPTTITHNFGISVHTELLHLPTPYPCRPPSPVKDRPMIVITRGLTGSKVNPKSSIAIGNYLAPRGIAALILLFVLGYRVKGTMVDAVQRT